MLFTTKLQDFARQQGVTDRQVHRLCNKYADELEGLFERRGVNGTWFSDEACEILRSKMKQHPIVVAETSEVVEALYQQLNTLHVALETAQAEIIALTKDKGELAAKVVKIELLEADNEAQRVKIAEAEQKALEANSEAHRAKQELQAEKSRKLTLKERLLGRKMGE